MDNLRKVIRVDRIINVYNKETDIIINEIPVKIKLEDLLKIIQTKSDDPLLFDGYILSEENLKALNKYLAYDINPQFDLYYYVLESVGIYNW